MNDTTLTIAGNVVDDPRMRLTKNGHAIATFRVASTSRRFDRESGTFVDNTTLFVTVTCWRGLAENASKSLRKGQPVVVTGRYVQREFKVDESIRIAYALEATALGHDLARGVSTFQRVRRVAATENIGVDDQGIPSDESVHMYDLAEEPVADLDAHAMLERSLAGAS